MRRAFVTGATGGLGRVLCQRLGADAAGCGRDVEAGAWLEAQGTHFQRLDILDAEGLAKTMTGHEVVFHCAALSSVWGRAGDFHAANVTGTANALAGARRAGARRFVFVSSPSIYFDFRDREKIREDDPLPARPVNAYAASKREAEALVHAAFGDGMDTVILRPRGIIGPWDRALAPRLERMARRGFVPLPGGGARKVDFTCTDNVVDAMLAAANAGPEIAGRVYNVSNGAPVSARELLETALEALELKARLISVPKGAALAAAGLLEAVARATGGWEPPITRYTIGLLAYDQTLDISAAKRDLGWTPKQTLAEGLSALARWRKSEARHEG